MPLMCCFPNVVTCCFWSTTRLKSFFLKLLWRALASWAYPQGLSKCPSHLAAPGASCRAPAISPGQARRSERPCQSRAHSAQSVRRSESCMARVTAMGPCPWPQNGRQRLSRAVCRLASSLVIVRPCAHPGACQRKLLQCPPMLLQPLRP